MAKYTQHFPDYRIECKNTNFLRSLTRYAAGDGLEKTAKSFPRTGERKLFR